MFPPRGAVRIIAAALSGDVEPLAALVAELEKACRPLGFPVERRAYYPHVTLARARTPLAPVMRAKLSDLAKGSWSGPEFTATELILMESRLKPQGAEYVPAARFGLQGACATPGPN